MNWDLVNRLFATAAIVFGAVSSRAFAAGGLIEFNRACATSASGRAPGDMGLAYPIEITASGSYRLTSDLTPGVGLDGIAIASGTMEL
jgi:hypothetical protein